MTAVPGTFTSGDELTGAEMEAIMHKPCVSAGRTSIQAIANNVTSTMQWNTEFFDTDAMHSNTTNNTRLTVPTGCAGLWMVTCTIPWSSVAGLVGRELHLRVSGSAIHAGHRQSPGSASITLESTATWLVNVSDGDYFEAVVYQNSGSTVNVDSAVGQGPEFTAVWMTKI